MVVALMLSLSCPRCGEDLGVEEDMLERPLRMCCARCGAVVLITPRPTVRYDIEDESPDDA